MSDPTGTPEGDVAIQPRLEPPDPPQAFKVLLHNDDFTTQDFVVEILSDIFGKSFEEAEQIMLSVHKEGIGLAGVYALAIAETKVQQVHELAQGEGFPLRCSVEPD